MQDRYTLPTDLDPVLQHLVDCWQAKVDHLGRVPMRSEMDLMELYEIAPRLFLADQIIDDGGNTDFRWRYWGSTLCRFVSGDFTNKMLSDTHDARAAAHAREIYLWSMQYGKPQYSDQGMRLNKTHKVFWRYERVIVPLLQNTHNRDGGPAADKFGHILGVYMSDHDIDASNRPHANEHPLSFAPKKS